MNRPRISHNISYTKKWTRIVWRAAAAAPAVNTLSARSYFPAGYSGRPGHPSPSSSPWRSRAWWSRARRSACSARPCADCRPWRPPGRCPARNPFFPRASRRHALRPVEPRGALPEVFALAVALFEPGVLEPAGLGEGLAQAAAPRARVSLQMSGRKPKLARSRLCKSSSACWNASRSAWAARAAPAVDSSAAKKKIAARTVPALDPSPGSDLTPIGQKPTARPR